MDFVDFCPLELFITSYGFIAHGCVKGKILETGIVDRKIIIYIMRMYEKFIRTKFVRSKL